MALVVVGHTLCGGTWVVKWEQRTERSVEVQIKLQHIVLVSCDVSIRQGKIHRQLFVSMKDEPSCTDYRDSTNMQMVLQSVLTDCLLRA